MASTKFDEVIGLCSILKQTPRTGWVRSNVNHPESIADHCMRTAMLAMMLCPPELNQQKATQIALIHDVAESIISDITPYDGISNEEKVSREDRAWTKISESLGNDQMKQLWLEMEHGTSPEGRFVKELDKLEMLIQAEEYENAQEGLDLSGFFTGFDYENFFTTPAVSEIYHAICARRAATHSK